MPSTVTREYAMKSKKPSVSTQGRQKMGGSPAFPANPKQMDGKFEKTADGCTKRNSL